MVLLREMTCYVHIKGTKKIKNSTFIDSSHHNIYTQTNEETN